MVLTPKVTHPIHLNNNTWLSFSITEGGILHPRTTVKKTPPELANLFLRFPILLWVLSRHTQVIFGLFRVIIFWKRNKEKLNIQVQQYVTSSEMFQRMYAEHLRCRKDSRCWMYWPYSRGSDLLNSIFKEFGLITNPA